MSRVIEQNDFPSAIRQKLTSIRWRAAGLACGRALAISLFVLVVSMILAMALDWRFTLFETGVRTLLTAVSLTLSLAALLYCGFRPVVEAFGWTRAAANVDDEIPLLEERWTTVASFAYSAHQPQTSVEKAMLQQVTSEAVAMGTLVKPRHVVRPSSLRTPALMLGGGLIALAAFLALNWGQTSVLLQRFWSPASEITATQLKSLTGDAVVPRGQSIELITQMSGLQRQAATFTMQTDSPLPERVELMPDPDQPGMFICKVDVDETFRYQLDAGDGGTEWHTVTAIDFPALAEVSLTVTPPQYTGHNPIQKSLIPGRLNAIHGSVLSLAMRSEAPLEKFELRVAIPGDEHDTDELAEEAIREILPLKPDADGWYRFQTPLIEDFALSTHLLNKHGLTNEDRRVCRIHVIADKEPVTRVISPTDEMAVSPDETIEIKFEAHDDFGIATAKLVIYDEAEDGEPRILEVRDIPLGDQELQKHVLASTTLDLKELGLKDGASISYSIRVTDNRTLDLDPDDIRRRLLASSEATSMKDHREKDDAPDADSVAEVATDSLDDQPVSDADRIGDSTESGSDNKPALENMIADATPAGDTTDTNPIGAEDADGNAEKNANKESDTASADTAADAADSDADQTDSGTAARSEASESDADADTDSAGSSRKLPSAADQATEGKDPQAGNSTDAASDRDDAADSEDRPSDSAAPIASAKQPGDEVANPDKSPGAVDAGKDEQQPTAETDSDTKVAGSQPVDSSADSDADGESESRNSLNVSSKTNSEDDPRTKPADGSANAGDQAENDRQPADSSNQPQGDDERPLAPKGQNPDAEQNADEGDPEADRSAQENPPNGNPPNGNPPNGNPQNTPQNGTPQNGNPQNGTPQNGTPNSKTGGQNKDQSDKDKEQDDKDKRRQSGSRNPLQMPRRMTAQSGDSGQRRETSKRRLKITDRLTAVAKAAVDRNAEGGQIRDRVVKIDEMLTVVEEELRLLVNKATPEAERSDRYRVLDGRLEEIETYISDLRVETKDGKFVFVGLQMDEIGRDHVTPARDRVYIAIRQPDLAADVHAKEALHHVISARELLHDLLKKYDRVVRDQKLAEELKEAVKMYEVYVEKTQQLMREARQNKNPLKRKMAVVEVDQAYLDRYAEVATLRREMLAEFARILADDPRLLARYMDLVKRRQSNLTNQLTELAERQYEISQEVSNWLLVQEAQKEILWTQVANARLQAAAPLAKNAEALATRIRKQMPLILDVTRGTAALVVEHAEQIALMARSSDLDATAARDAIRDSEAKLELSPHASAVVYELSELMAALDQLNFEADDKEGVTDYVTARVAESRILADQADAWAEAAAFVEQRRYAGLAQVDQQQTAIATELLRVDMLDIETGLEGQFREAGMPQEIRNLTRELNTVMEAITFNQAAAAFALSKNQMERATAQQTRALDGFDRAEDLIKKLRRKVVDILDEQEVQNPNIADLRDPTLDEFLARLEREPNIEAQLGIPGRPRNLREIRESMMWNQQGGTMLGQSSNAAAQRALKMSKRRLNQSTNGQQKQGKPAEEPREMTEDEKKRLAQAKDMQEMLKQKMERKMQELQKQATAPDTTAEQKERARQQAEAMKRLLDQMNDGGVNDDAWGRLTRAEDAKAMLEAMARGEALPDSVWNKVTSKLSDGLSQARNRIPPKDYRKMIESYQLSISRLTTDGLEEDDE